jgi:L-asparagine transporter-like permease
VLSIAGGFKTMATIASASSLIIYMGVVLATIKMRKKDPGGSKTGFRIPGGYTIPVLASIVILWLLNGLEREDLKASLIFVGVVALIYPLMVFLKRRKGQHDPS